MKKILSCVSIKVRRKFFLFTFRCQVYYLVSSYLNGFFFFFTKWKTLPHINCFNLLKLITVESAKSYGFCLLNFLVDFLWSQIFKIQWKLIFSAIFIHKNLAPPNIAPSLCIFNFLIFHILCRKMFKDLFFWAELQIWSANFKFRN